MCPSSKKIPLPWIISGCTPALIHSFCKMFDSVLNTSCLSNCSVIFRTLCYVLHQAHSELWHIQDSVYSGICRHIEAYLALLRQIQAYSVLSSVILSYLQPSHILRLGIFRTGGIFKTLWNFDQAYTEPCHIYKISKPWCPQLLSPPISS